MQSYKVEYLMVLDSKEIFCKSVESFNSLLQSDDYIEISDKNIRFKGNSYGYEVQFVEISKENRFFHLKLSCDNSSLLEDFRVLLKSVRKILAKISGDQPEILWNDIGTQLSCEAYPILHEIENTLRKLITKFMLTTVGITWTTATVPQEIIRSLKDKTDTTDIRPQNYLHKTDFIQLSTFLFKEYPTANSEELIKVLRKANDFSELSFDAFKKMVPQSNWDRYFSPVVDCESDYLKTRWEKLYKLRCKIAHNRFIDENEFDEIRRIAEEIKPKLLKAIEKLDDIHVSPEQKEEVVENIASNVNERYSEFVRQGDEYSVFVYQDDECGVFVRQDDEV
jgi:hypothetical protein